MLWGSERAIPFPTGTRHTDRSSKISLAFRPEI